MRKQQDALEGRVSLVRHTHYAQEKKQALIGACSIDDQEPEEKIDNQERETQIERPDFPVSTPKNQPGSYAIRRKNGDKLRISKPRKGGIDQDIVEKNIRTQDDRAKSTQNRDLDDVQVVTVFVQLSQTVRSVIHAKEAVSLSPCRVAAKRRLQPFAGTEHRCKTCCHVLEMLPFFSAVVDKNSNPKKVIEIVRGRRGEGA
jgi:hypothetical protein